MAAQSGTEHLDLTPATGRASFLAEVEREMRARPGLFEFFQAVRLLHRMYPERGQVGLFVAPQREAVRFGAHHSLTFPATQIFSLDLDSDPPVMRVNFMGLTGPVSVLPYAYSEFVMERIRAKDHTLGAFLDLFNHRMLSLFYQAWEKYRFEVAYERDGKDRMSRYLMTLIGMGTPGLQGRLAVRDEALLYYSGLLSLQPRSATALRNILEDYFEAPVEVEQFVGSWQTLDPAERCVFEGADSTAEQLSVGAVVGDAIWDRESRVRIKLGPLSQEQYLSFLPCGGAWEPLRALTKFFCGPSLEVEVQLILKQPEVPRCEIGNESEAGPRLGWLTWMKSGTEFDRSPGDTFLLLM